MGDFPSAITIGASTVLIAVILWRGWRIFRQQPCSLDNVVFFFGLAFAAMLALRWGRIVYAEQFNPDESQMMAQAMRFLSHPVPWRDVDGTTSGPLNSLFLAVPLWFGAPPTWETGRLALFTCNCAVVLLAYFSLRRFITRAEAQFALTPLLLFYGFTTSSDFTHYSSETLSSLVLAACFYLLAKQWTSGPSTAAMAIMGALLGALPFAKLQTAPLAAFLGAIALTLIYAKRNRVDKILDNPRRLTVTLLVGCVFVPVLILGVVLANGAIDDFWKSYILSSRHYAVGEHMLSSGRLAEVPALAKRFIYVGYILLFPTNLGMFFVSGLGALFVLWGVYRAKKTALPNNIRWPLFLVIVYGCLTILCFFIAGKPFGHYGALLAPALALLAGLVFCAGKTALGMDGRIEFKRGKPSVHWLTAFAIVVIGVQLYLGPLRIYQAANSNGSKFVPQAPSFLRDIRSVTHSGDTLSVWGWMPECHVRTGLPPATRDAICHYVISPGLYQDYYRQRHLQDLERSRPAIFIDAVADGTFLCWKQWTVADRHESFPELAKFIDDNYSLLGSFQLTPEVNVGPIRVYALKERHAPH